MNSDAQSRDAALWQALVQAEGAFYGARAAFVTGAQDRVEVLRGALRSVAGRGTALRLLPLLPEAERMAVFDDLVAVASIGHADVRLGRNVILSLPRQWVLERIERVADPLLRGGDEEEYRRLLELYREIDPDLTRRLARRATEHENPDVREAGEDFLA